MAIGRCKVSGKTGNTMRANPQLSIVIADTGRVDEIETCLRGLVIQARGKRTEIIVTHRRHDGSMAALEAAYPDVAFVSPSAEANLPMLLEEGIAKSSGEIIAITDASCATDDRWLASILEAHRSAGPVVGGAVEPASLVKLLDWAAYFCDYGQFMRPLVEGAAGEVPGNNFSFKRWALGEGESAGLNTPGGFWKSHWCNRLRQQGFELMLTPSVVLRSGRTYRFIPFLRRRFHHARCFAGMRLEQASIGRRLLYLVGSPFLPFLFFARLVRKITPKHKYLREFVLSTPLIAAAVTSWSVGEFCGYLCGAGRSCTHVY
jgi:hypothetical protein